MTTTTPGIRCGGRAGRDRRSRCSRGFTHREPSLFHPRAARAHAWPEPTRGPTAPLLSPPHSRPHKRDTSRVGPNPLSPFPSSTNPSGPSAFWFLRCPGRPWILSPTRVPVGSGAEGSGWCQRFPSHRGPGGRDKGSEISLHGSSRSEPRRALN